jgi:hypothetical protein
LNIWFYLLVVVVFRLFVIFSFLNFLHIFWLILEINLHIFILIFIFLLIIVFFINYFNFLFCYHLNIINFYYFNNKKFLNNIFFITNNEFLTNINREILKTNNYIKGLSSYDYKFLLDPLILSSLNEQCDFSDNLKIILIKSRLINFNIKHPQFPCLNFRFLSDSTKYEIKYLNSLLSLLNKNSNNLNSHYLHYKEISYNQYLTKLNFSKNLDLDYLTFVKSVTDVTSTYIGRPMDYSYKINIEAIKAEKLIELYDLLDKSLSNPSMITLELKNILNEKDKPIHARENNFLPDILEIKNCFSPWEIKNISINKDIVDLTLDRDEESESEIVNLVLNSKDVVSREIIEETVPEKDFTEEFVIETIKKISKEILEEIDSTSIKSATISSISENCRNPNKIIRVISNIQIKKPDSDFIYDNLIIRLDFNIFFNFIYFIFILLTLYKYIKYFF